MGMLSKKTEMLSNQMGMLSNKMGGRALESLCFGCSPKGPRQLGEERAGNGANRKSNPIHQTNFPGAAFVHRLSACAWQRRSPRAISSGQSQERMDVPTAAQPPRAPPCPRVPVPVPSPAWPLRESLHDAVGIWADPVLPGGAAGPASPERRRTHMAQMLR